MWFFYNWHYFEELSSARSYFFMHLVGSCDASPFNFLFEELIVWLPKSLQYNVFLRLEVIIFFLLNPVQYFSILLVVLLLESN